MDFPKCIDAMGHKAHVGHSWWNQLLSESDPVTSPASAAFALRLNVEQSRLFELNNRQSDHLAAFCEALENSTSGSSVERAQSAISSAQISGAAIMISAGPPAGPLGSGACALIEFRSFLARYLRPGIRGPVGPRGADFDADVWEALDDARYYGRAVNPTTAYRGRMPNRFWAVLDDIEALHLREPTDAARLRHFLGLDDNSKPCLLIRIRSGSEPVFSIPTGWDGFDNRHFLENDSYDPADVASHYGFTRDIGAVPPRIRGAREVVAVPVAASDTQMVRKYE